MQIYAFVYFRLVAIAPATLHKSIWALCASGFIIVAECVGSNAVDHTNYYVFESPLLPPAIAACYTFGRFESYPESVFKANFICNTICMRTHIHRPPTFPFAHFTFDESNGFNEAETNCGERESND